MKSLIYMLYLSIFYFFANAILKNSVVLARYNLQLAMSLFITDFLMHRKESCKLGRRLVINLGKRALALIRPIIKASC
jgi:hypothetical protein